VAVAGSRICKTDVGWIGAGYEMAFDGVELCAGGIENNSDARRFIWTVCAAAARAIARVPTARAAAARTATARAAAARADVFSCS